MQIGHRFFLLILEMNKILLQRDGSVAKITCCFFQRTWVQFSAFTQLLTTPCNSSLGVLNTHIMAPNCLSLQFQGSQHPNSSSQLSVIPVWRISVSTQWLLTTCNSSLGILAPTQWLPIACNSSFGVLTFHTEVTTISNSNLGV